MTDRDSHRRGDPLHAREEHGTCDSGDGRDYPTPPLGRPHPVEVDPSAFDPDTRWEDFADIKREVAACKAERLQREKWKRWVFGGQFIGGGTVIGLLLWAVTKLDSRADAAAAERQRIREHEQILIHVRQLQDASIRTDERLKALRINPTRPDSLRGAP
jgi:hypothetical protein